MINNEIKKQITSIINSMSDEDRECICGDYGMEFAVYAQVFVDQDKPVAFIYFEDISECMDKSGEVADLNVVIGVSKEYRRKGIAQGMVKDGIKWFINSDYEQLLWQAANEGSDKLAEKCGFTYGWINDDEIVRIITNPSKIVWVLDTERDDIMNKRANPTNNPVEVANAYEHYGLNEKSKNKDAVPAWMEDVLTKKKETPRVSDFEGIYP